MQQAIQQMTCAIGEILRDCHPSVYLYGSCVLDDFHLGWSDIDLLVLTLRQMSPAQAQNLVCLRQTLSDSAPGNPYYRLFEGGMLTLSAFCTGTPDRVVYWGTRGQKITDSYVFDSFCMDELLRQGKLLWGEELREQLAAPTCADLCRDVAKHLATIRQYAQTTGRSIYTYNWLLDIARGLYTLQTGAVTSKTHAAQWVLAHGECPVPEALETALRVRKCPSLLQTDPSVGDRAETLGPAIQRFADVLEQAFCAVDGGCAPFGGHAEQ